MIELHIFRQRALVIRWPNRLSDIGCHTPPDALAADSVLYMALQIVYGASNMTLLMQDAFTLATRTQAFGRRPKRDRKQPTDRNGACRRRPGRTTRV